MEEFVDFKNCKDNKVVMIKLVVELFKLIGVYWKFCKIELNVKVE